MFVFQLASITVDKVKELVNSHCPDAVAKAILESKNPQEKINAVKKALEQIVKASNLESRGSWISWRAKKSGSERVLEWLARDDYAKLFVRHPGELAEISKAAGGGTQDAFETLSDKTVMRLFDGHAKEFVEIANVATSYTRSAFEVFLNIRFAEYFDKESKKATEALVGSFNAFGIEMTRSLIIHVGNFFVDHHDIVMKMLSEVKTKAKFRFLGEQLVVWSSELFAKYNEKFIQTANMGGDYKKIEHALSAIPDRDRETFLSGANFEETRKLMKELKIATPTGDEVINFTYGIMKLGKKKVTELYKNFGIGYFIRYSDKLLDEMYNRIEDKQTSEKPVLLVAHNKDDKNGAFYHDSEKLETLTKYYRIVVVEVSTEDAFYDSVAGVARDYGQIDTMIIGGHGAIDSILLDGRHGEKGNLDLTDKQELSKLRKYFVDDPTMILESCFTGAKGDSMGEMMSDVWNAHLFAPEIEAAVKRYILQEDGKILSVEYTVMSTEYLKWIPRKKGDDG